MTAREAIEVGCEPSRWEFVTMTAEGPLRITVDQQPNALLVRMRSACTEHATSFESLGLTRIDGDAYLQPTLMIDFLPSTLLDSGLWECEEATTLISSKLPPLPEGISPTDPRPSLLTMMLANRFRGYPPSFYEGLLKDIPLLCRAYPLTSGLPVCADELDRSYALTELPQGGSLEQLLLSNPLIIHRMIQQPDLPFSEPDVLYRFLASPRLPAMLAAINAIPRGVQGWRRLASAKGEAAVLRFLEQHADSAFIEPLARALNGRSNDVVIDADELLRMPLHRMHDAFADALVHQLERFCSQDHEAASIPTSRQGDETAR